MKKIATLVAAAALSTVSMTASAWWGGPFNGLGDGFGNGDASFSMNFSGRSRFSGYGDGYGYNQPYYGYPYQGAYAPVAPLTEEQQQAMEQQQRAFAEQQAKAMQDAVEAQRKFAEEFTMQPQPFVAPDAAQFELPADIQARRDEMQKQMELVALK